MPVTRSQSPKIREQILREATRLFATRGFDGTALQHIADAVGIRKPSLLYHFPSKDSLRQSVLDQLLSHWNSVLPQVLAAATSSHDRFDRMLQVMVTFFCEDTDRARLLLREALDRPQDMRQLILEHVAPWVQVVSNYIREGQQEGRLLTDADPEAYIIQLINLLVSSIATHDALGTIDAERNIAEIVRIAKASLFRPET